ncbi:UNVERIFIED_CONTAM: hypothetical protein GTU68_064115 [Idotea baltica]|nr:hypothetical protein [Idotea baltica]
MIKVGIIGGAGYTAGELIRVLLHHPLAEIAFIHSNSQAGKPINHIHTDLVGETDLVFSQEVNPEVDVLFFCAGHGKTEPFLAAHSIPKTVKIIDLSSDFRIKSANHDFVYGLPELNRNVIQDAQRIANPGCFATAIQLALLPLAKAELLNQDVNIHAITGSTGAGQQPMPTTHFSWRNNNMSIYKAFRHQHLKEIRQSLQQLQPSMESDLDFLPLRGDFPRGIFASLYMKSTELEATIHELYESYYDSHPFTHLTDQNPHLKQVVNTNKCMLHVQKIDDKVLIISMIDNLLKGASGQAIQNMNLMFGFPETEGLGLKALVF